MKKIIEINPYMLGTMAGGAADCQFWHRNLGIKVMVFKVSFLNCIGGTNCLESELTCHLEELLDFHISQASYLVNFAQSKNIEDLLQFLQNESLFD